MITKPLKNTRILISGASIAGPALAYWLQRYGFTVTVIEQSPQLRTGGYKVDTRGTCIDVLKSMGIYEQVKKFHVHTKSAIFVDDEGNTVMEMPATELGMREKEDIELLRGDLSNLLYEASRDNCDYIFGDSIKSISQTGDEIEVQLVHGQPRTFDLLVGADGIHSNVRSLIFGDEQNFLYDLGHYYYGIYSVENYLNFANEEVFYSKNNKQINLSFTNKHDAFKVIYLFQDTQLMFNYRDVEQHKETLIKQYQNGKWETPALLKAMDSASDFYFDAVRQVRMQSWSKGRVVLVGDAAYSPALTSGQGSSIAIVGAYVLAGELFAAGGNYETAFRSYEQLMSNYVKLNQALGETVMQFILPKNTSRISGWINKLKSWVLPKDYAIKKLRQQFLMASNGIKLKDYVI
ncbi:FAD-dependent monooxygenase [Legionella bononiensis]|uniref:FAD-dependent monooxygenase n=1 Tax=Legionella bononiensis TaxID=2793102 RepID=A0ABS1WFC4_9GAMM|nr:FAD-dependent monooxygenase [Legionella bononiensis]MBL7479219.1 FAD-dependent monooxygenase [Legionella bononiensis]MBL7528054.1 FAD-dependent monooxygenase [Legionella bononiensis]MBL7563869.1 FAD-dependent monooxygenase [Legionella bononiensis]